MFKNKAVEIGREAFLNCPIKNINLEISPYKKVALVGYNGAGKTTLTNLILRLYDVTDGVITINGVDIKEWDIKEYHKNFAAVFQDFSLFGATLGENISMDDTPDAEKAEEALEKAGLTEWANKYQECCDYLKSINLYEDNGYKFGCGWLKRDIPSQDLEIIKGLLK